MKLENQPLFHFCGGVENEKKTVFYFLTMWEVRERSWTPLQTVFVKK
jgi:hypothetical protein